MEGWGVMGKRWQCHRGWSLNIECWTLKWWEYLLFGWNCQQKKYCLIWKYQCGGELGQLFLMNEVSDYSNPHKHSTASSLTASDESVLDAMWLIQPPVDEWIPVSKVESQSIWIFVFFCNGACGHLGPADAFVSVLGMCERFNCRQLF